MAEQFCPECGGSLFYDSSTKRYACRGCGLYATKDELLVIKEKMKRSPEDMKKRRQQHDEYLEWWLSSKK